jgi:hypothetical protein
MDRRHQGLETGATIPFAITKRASAHAGLSTRSVARKRKVT